MDNSGRICYLANELLRKTAELLPIVMELAEITEQELHELGDILDQTDDPNVIEAVNQKKEQLEVMSKGIRQGLVLMSMTMTK